MNFYVVAWILAITQIAFMQGEEIADIDSHFKKLVDFAQDFGNGKVVTQLPTEALQSLVDAITENYVPSLPQFYAGTSGAISTSVGKPLTRYPMLLEPKFVNGECTDGVCFSDEKAKVCICLIIFGVSVGISAENNNEYSLQIPHDLSLVVASILNIPLLTPSTT